MTEHEEHLKNQGQGLSVSDLMSLLQQDQVNQWKDELPLKVEDYLRLFPTLQDDVENVLVLIMSEIIQREARRHTIEEQEYLNRFPHLCEQIKLQLEFHRALGQPTVAIQGTGSLGTSATSSSLAGKLIADKYLLRECIGEGGMGTVWRAEQLAPVKRQVAIKLIKTGLDTRTVMARFEAERQALAIMEHPNIAKVLDGGVTPENEPYFVMELVKGSSITRYCDHNKLSIRHRLELFLPVCSAIQHAHQKGIIHRDIKPSNVLVALYDLKPIPKVIDFGVAKAIHDPLTDVTLETGIGNVIGTPEYMSPEQASLNNLDIDTRTDVYSLGVLLYELLTGNPPFRNEDYRQAGLLEMLRVIRDEEPPRPSDRLSSSKLLATISMNRGALSTKLVDSLRNDLDLVVMKAMAKERSQRYASSDELGDDLRRYLAGEPVNAHPPSSWYRLRKLVLKRKGTFAAATLLILSVLAGIVGTTWGYLRAEERRKDAEEARSKETAQRILAEQHAEAAKASKELEIKQRVLTEKAWERALQALDAMTSTAAAESLSSQQGITSQQRSFLNEAIKYYQEYAQTKADDLYSRNITARASYSLGLIHLQLGQRAEAEKYFRLALEHRRLLIQTVPNDQYQRNATASCLASLGVVLNDTARYPDAKSMFTESVAIMNKLTKEYPNEKDYQTSLANIYTNLGILYSRIGRASDAALQEQLAIHIREKLCRDHPENIEYQQLLARSFNNYGVALINRQSQREAESAFRRGMLIREKLLKQQPTSREARHDAANSYSNLGAVLSDLKVLEDSRRYLLQAQLIQESLVADYPNIQKYQIDLAGTLCNIGNICFDLGELETSLRWYDGAEKRLKPILTQQPDLVHARRFYSNCCLQRGKVLADMNRHLDAVHQFDQVLKYSTRTSQQKADYRLLRAQSLLATHAYQATYLEVRELSKLTKWKTQNLYDLARLCCQAGAALKEQANDYPELTITLLKRAIESGFSDRAKLSSDVAFRSLSDRPEFKKLLKSTP